MEHVSLAAALICILLGWHAVLVLAESVLVFGVAGLLRVVTPLVDILLLFRPAIGSGLLIGLVLVLEEPFATLNRRIPTV